MNAYWLALPLALASCSEAPETNVGYEKARLAINTANHYATIHYGAPSCRDPNSNWTYHLRRSGDALIAEMGPKLKSPSPIRITMRMSDLKITQASNTQS